ncbi:holliday junction resolvase [Shewanella sp. phage 1/41]|uniref:holliday junction resolvase n=1 Tax=Shewanella sp. phage 1/41 TaxID=1458861 RepID=UPI0004F7021E|nr:holliday junction resolvase [Shewanella sp. phage 1/41]AHK11710.1 holliday junction resolvase [Shewanella sp. phage 1/41]
MNLSKIPPQIPVFGDTTFRGACPMETAEQISFLSLLRAEFPEMAEIAVHIRNEGKRTKRQGAQQKVEGMNTGASDIIIPCNPPILIELKRRDHTQSSSSAKQLKYLIDSHAQGAFACYALGAVGAIMAVRAWHSKNKK